MKEKVCKQCGCADPSLFYKRGLYCKKCVSAKNNTRYHSLPETEKRLYRKRVAAWQDANIFQYRMLSARARANKANLAFELDAQMLESLFEQQKGLCFYSGLEMTRSRDGKFSVSVDRKDNSLGYIPSNVVLCCWFINSMKSDLSSRQFIEIAHLIATHQKIQCLKSQA